MNRDLRVSLIGTSCLLVIFWLIVVSTLEMSIVLLGVLSVGIIVWLLKEFILTQEVRFPLHVQNIARIFKYIAYLVYEIVVANVQVAKIVLSRDMNISPTFIRFTSQVNKDVTKAILGNSITLTPGTLTVDIDENEFVVHGLTMEHAEGPTDWYMVDQLVMMEEKEEEES